MGVDRGDLVVAQVERMDQKAPVRKQVVVHEALDDVLVVDVMRVHHVVLVLGHMQMDAASGLLDRIGHHGQGLVRKRERGMAADHGLDHHLVITLIRIDLLGEADVLLDALLDLLHPAVAVRDLVAGDASQADLLHSTGDGAQRPLDI